MMQIITILLATLAAMVLLILINSMNSKTAVDQSKLYIPIEDETDHKRSD